MKSRKEGFENLERLFFNFVGFLIHKNQNNNMKINDFILQK